MAIVLVREDSLDNLDQNVLGVTDTEIEMGSLNDETLQSDNSLVGRIKLLQYLLDHEAKKRCDKWN